MNRQRSIFYQAIKKGIDQAFFEIAFLYFEQGNVRKAEKYYLKSIKKGIDQAFFEIAVLYFEQKKL